MSRDEPAGGIGNPYHLERPLKVTLSCTQTCNLDCKHCYADCSEQHATAEMRGEEWRALADRLIEDGVISLFIEGGEPFRRSEDLLALVRHCAPRMMTRIRTNGTLVSPAVAHEFKAAGLGGCLVDVMGASAGTHDRMTGTPGSFEAACAGISALLAAGIPTEMLLILNRHNVGELDDYMALAQRLGVRKVGILRLYPIGRAKRHWSELALSMEEMTAALAALHPPPGIKLMQSWHPNDGNCCWQMAAIDPFGRSIGCSYLREFVDYGDVRVAGLLPTWDHPLYRTLRAGKVERSCGSCAASQGSHGGCRSTAYAFTGRWTAPDPFDATLNDGVDLRVLPDWLLQTGARRPHSSRARTRDLHGIHAGRPETVPAEPERLAHSRTVPGSHPGDVDGGLSGGGAAIDDSSRATEGRAENAARGEDRRAK